MGLPTFVAASTVQAGAGDITVAIPTGATTNDILLLFVQTDTANTISATDFVHTADSPSDTGGAAGASVKLHCLWKRHDGSEADITLSDPGDHQIGVMLAFRGCVLSGDPWNVTSSNQQTTGTTSASITGDTTTVTNCLIVAATSNSTDSATTQYSNWANADLAGVAERVNSNSTAGNGGGIGIITGSKVVAGAYGATTADIATSTKTANITIALKGATDGGGWGVIPL